LNEGTFEIEIEIEVEVENKLTKNELTKIRD